VSKIELEEPTKTKRCFRWSSNAAHTSNFREDELAEIDSQSGVIAKVECHSRTKRAFGLELLLRLGVEIWNCLGNHQPGTCKEVEVEVIQDRVVKRGLAVERAPQDSEVCMRNLGISDQDPLRSETRC